jgi:hypothetical protein
MSIVGALKRRRVFQVAAVYAEELIGLVPTEQ